MNHTVDTDADSEPEISPNMDKPDFAELKSKPSFDVDLQLGDKTLSFTCSFIQSDSMQQSDDYSMYKYISLKVIQSDKCINYRVSAV